MKTVIFFILLSLNVNSQSNIDRLIKGGEILMTGLTILTDKGSPSKNGMIQICVKNRQPDKITFVVSGKDSSGVATNKSLVVPKDGKECFLELPSGIYTYEVISPNKDVVKRGECRFEESTTITVKP